MITFLHAKFSYFFLPWTIIPLFKSLLFSNQKVGINFIQ